MSHDVESAMFVGEGAWHGLGTVFKEAPDIPEALVVSGLDWRVTLEPVFVERASLTADFERVHDFERVPTGHKAVIRSSDQKVLGVVGPDYMPLQNEDAFAPFEPLIESGMLKLNAAGSLRGGSRLWILAKLANQEAEVVPGDPVGGYLLCYTSHDGSLRASYQHTAVRVVCANTLALAIGRADAGKETRIQFRHTASIKDRTLNLTEQFARVGQEFEEGVAIYRFLAGKPCPNARKYFRQVLELPEEREAPAERGLYGAMARARREEREQAHENGKRQLKTLEALLLSQPGTEFAPDSMWQSYNAVTFWIDHERGYDDDSRLNSSWLGDGRKIRERALRIAVEA